MKGSMTAAAVHKQYEDGRVTVISDTELMKITNIALFQHGHTDLHVELNK